MNHIYFRKAKSLRKAHLPELRELPMLCRLTSRKAAEKFKKIFPKLFFSAKKNPCTKNPDNKIRKNKGPLTEMEFHEMRSAHAHLSPKNQ